MKAHADRRLAHGIVQGKRAHCHDYASTTPNHLFTWTSLASGVTINSPAQQGWSCNAYWSLMLQVGMTGCGPPECVREPGTQPVEPLHVIHGEGMGASLWALP
jgi:hypothetical protein